MSMDLATVSGDTVGRPVNLDAEERGGRWSPLGRGP